MTRQPDAVVMDRKLRARQPGLEPSLPLITVCPWMSELASLCLTGLLQGLDEVMLVK